MHVEILVILSKGGLKKHDRMRNTKRRKYAWRGGDVISIHRVADVPFASWRRA